MVHYSEQNRRRYLAYAALFITLLTLCVIGLGAWVRLSDAGLGCPDWPGCYGKLIGVPNSQAEIAQAALSFPQSPVDPERAIKEMVHRYLAGTLGLGILCLNIFGWKYSSRMQKGLLLSLLGVVSFQAVLGMLTVTRLLKPVIVDAHLLGGMATLALLLSFWLSCKPNFLTLRNHPDLVVRNKPALWFVGWLALFGVIVQIAIGGWVSSNYAALACSGFPDCNGAWWPENMEFAHAFWLNRDLGLRADGEFLGQGGLVAIHMLHRLGAIAVTVIVLAFALLLSKAGLKLYALILFFALILQVTLGIANVLFSLPLALAVSHNICAALLLSLCLISLWKVMLLRQ